MSTPMPPDREPAHGAARRMMGPADAPPPVRRVRTHDIAWEENKSRLVGIANSHLRQGKQVEAKAVLEELLAHAPDDAAVHELNGDVAAARGDWPGAVAAFKMALHKEPGRPTAEVKLAKAALGQYERTRLINMDASALRGGDTAVGGDMGREALHKKWAIFLTVVLPGAGHFLLGQPLKAGILAGVSLLGGMIFASLPGTQALLTPAAHVAATGKAVGAAASTSSGPSIFLLVILVAIWIYAVVDATNATRAEPKLEDLLNK